MDNPILDTRYLVPLAGVFCVLPLISDIGLNRSWGRRLRIMLGFFREFQQGKGIKHYLSILGAIFPKNVGVF